MFCSSSANFPQPITLIVLGGASGRRLSNSASISAIGVLVFAGLTAYDTQRIKAMYYDGYGQEGKKAIMGALTLYLDFINLFIMLIQLFGQRR